jgi:hypothetical protein
VARLLVPVVRRLPAPAVAAAALVREWHAAARFAASRNDDLIETTGIG